MQDEALLGRAERLVCLANRVEGFVEDGGIFWLAVIESGGRAGEKAVLGGTRYNAPR